MRVNGSEGGPARLAWYTVEKDGGYAGDILAAFELFLVSCNDATKWVVQLFSAPDFNEVSIVSPRYFATNAKSI